MQHWLAGVPKEEQERVFRDADAIAGAAIRRGRLMLGWSQRELAEELEKQTGVSLDPSAITRMEAGQRTISLRQALALAFVLDEMGTDELFNESGDPGLEAWVEELEKSVTELEQELREQEIRTGFVKERLAGHRRQLEGVRKFVELGGTDEQLEEVRRQARRKRHAEGTASDA